MRRRAQGRGFFSWAFSFGLLGVLAAFSAWKFGWLPIDVAEREAETLGDSTAGNAAPPFGSTEPPTADAASSDLFVMDPQSDPFLEAERRASNTSAGRMSSSGTSLSAQRWDDPVLPSIPRRLPTAAGASPIGRPDGSSGRPRIEEPRSSIVQVANEVVEKPGSPTPALPQLQEIDRLLDAGETMTAHRELSKLYWNRPELRAAIQTRIEATSRSIYFEPQPHYLQPYVVQPGDQLRLIARKYNVPWEYLAGLNKVDPQKIHGGQRLKVNNGPFSAVVDLSDFEVTVHSQGYVVHRYPVGIGKDNSTPIGKFTVTDKMVNPQYTDPEGRVFAADDPENPMGERWLAIGNGYGIHGTIAPASIGRAESRGCIRMHNADAVEVYDLLVISSAVIIQR